jgi:hypothetical protein
MLNFDPQKPFYRALFVILGLAIGAFGVASMWRGNLSFENGWGGLFFAPFAVVFGIIFIAGAIFKPSIFRK